MAQAGYNVQLGKIVLGIEGDYGWSNANGGKQCPGFFFTCNAELDSLASLTGRVGYSFGRALFYAKGGWAGGEVVGHGNAEHGADLSRSPWRPSGRMAGRSAAAWSSR